MNLFEKHKKSGWKAFETYRVKIKCRDLVSGIPKDPELLRKWINARCKDKTEAEREAIRLTHLEHLEEVIDETADKQAIGFLRMEDGQLAVEGRCIKAMLKEAGNIIRQIAPGGKPKKGKNGITALRSKVADRVFVVEQYIPLGRTEPDSVEERPIHVMTPQGPRSSIKRFEVLYGVEVDFTVKRCRDPKGEGVPEEALLAILDYAQTSALGTGRSQGTGTFEVLNVEKIEG
jgi:hypothetical protein